MSDADIAVVRRLCEQWAWLSRQDFHALFTPDCLYLNIPMPEVRNVGPDAAHRMLSRMCERWEVSLQVIHIAAAGTAVLAERLERFNDRASGVICELPVMGAFELKDGNIAAWRDYFDLAQAKPLLG
jgi:limonene-1,2-epoxide hydrolase